MGAFGYYDDENDNVLDIWENVTRLTLPKYFIDLTKNVDEHEALDKVIDSYLYKNINKLQKNIEIWIEKEMKKLIDYENIKSNIKKLINQESIKQNIVGICIKLAKFINNNSNSNLKNSYETLPKKYPSLLRKQALRVLNLLTNTVEENIFGWNSIKLRKLVLQHELYLFSNGKYGIKCKQLPNR